MLAILKSFISTLKKYKAASFLNFIGLSVAFAAVILIGMQLTYDLGYDRFNSKFDRIVRFQSKMSPGGSYTSSISRPILEKVAESSEDIVDFAVLDWANQITVKADTYSENYPYREEIMKVSTGLFEIFDFDFIAGDHNDLGSYEKIVVSESQAKRFFPDTDALGGHIYFKDDSTAYKITGIYKDFPKNSYLKNIIYKNIFEEGRNSWSEWNYKGFALINSRDRLAEINAGIIPFLVGSGTWSEDTPDDYCMFVPLKDIHGECGTRYDEAEKINYKMTATLAIIGLLILIIASINFINFSMSLVPARVRTVNTQKVLGCSVGSIRASFIFEGAALSFLSAVFSIFLVYLISTTSFSGLISADINISSNLIPIITVMVLSIIAGAVAGIYPAYYITSFPPALVLKGSYGLTPKGRKLRTALICFQYIVSFILIICAIYVRVQTDYMKKHDMGFDRERLLIVDWIPYGVAERQETLTQLLKNNNEIVDVAYAAGRVVSNGKMGWGRPFKGTTIQFDCFPISSNFIEMMGMEMAEGRAFTSSDDLREEGTFIFNETAAREFEFTLDDMVSGHQVDAPIAGFVKDFNFQPLQFPVGPIALYVFGSNPWYALQTVYIRVSSADLKGVINYIELTIREMDPSFSGELKIMPLDDTIRELYEKEENLTKLITIFSLLAIFISLIGVFDLILFETQYRSKEISLRKINGATVGEILMMFNTSFIRIVLVCFVISIPLAIIVIRKWVVSFSYKSPVHIWIFIAALALILLITIVTVTLQSYRAATDNPINSIKSE